MLIAMIFAMRSSVRLCLCLILAASGWAGIANAQTPVQVGFRDFSFGSSVNPNPTGEKPESKLWFNDGIWWGSLFNSTALQYRIYRFSPATQAWTDTGTGIDARTESKADALWDAGTQRLYIVSHLFTESGAAASSSAQWGKLYRFSYSPGSQSYTLDAGFPVDVTRGKSESLTIAKDFNQRLWVTYVEGAKVKINWSLGDDLTWSTPITMPGSTSATSVDSDDISAIIALPNGDVGVMWSNQKTKSTYFSRHRAADAPGVWQSIEAVLPGIGCSGACADDHINLKTDQFGRIFAIVKTSLDTSGKPNLILAVRDSSWTLYTVTLGQQNETRGIVLLDEENGLIYVFASPTGGGPVYMKTSPLDTIGFAPGMGDEFIKSSTDSEINNPTSMKQNVTGSTGVLVLASDEGSRRYLHNYLSLAPPVPTPPLPPADLLAQAVSGSQVHLEWTDASSNEQHFEVERATGAGPFALLITLSSNITSYEDNSVSPSQIYSYRVRATNSVGPSGYSTTAVVTTPAPAGAGNLKVITFEGGSITDPATGVDDVSGTIVVETASALKGGVSARLNSRPAYLIEEFPAAANLYVSFYLRMNALPSSDVQLLRILNNSSQVGTLVLRSNGQLQLRNNSSTVGSVSTALVAGQTYRIGIHQRARVGSSNNGVLEAFLASGDNAFPAAFAALTNGSWTSSATELRLGTVTSVTANLVFDDIKLDNSGMPPGIPPPAAPANLEATALSATSVKLEWDDASADETAFRVERAGTNGVFFEIATTPANAVDFTDSTATAATGYTYRVRAEKSGVFGSYSNIATVTTPDVPPQAPSGLTVSAASSNAVLLSWVDNSSNEVAFSIERAVGNGAFVEILAPLAANTTSHIDNSVAPATAYRYRIRAWNGVGSSFSNEPSVVTPLPVIPPADPSNLNATAPAVNQVQLTWQDNSSTETLFRIERRTGAAAFAEIGSVPGNQTSFVDSTVAAGAVYTYQVFATNSQMASGYSNQATVTTPTSQTAGQGLKWMTFESGLVTDPTTGADLVSGTVTFEMASPIKGTRSAKITGSAYLQEDFTATGDLYFTFYLKPLTLPSDARIALITNGSNTVGNLLLRSTGQLSLRNGSNQVGLDSTPLSTGTVYRVLIHQRTSPRLLEAFVAQGDTPFGAPFASTTSGSWSGTSDRVRIGGTTGTVNMVFDDVRLDTASPPPSSAPNAPSALLIESTSSTAVVLRWTENATNEETLRVERSQSSGPYIEIASLGANVASYTDTTVSASTPYAYRVRAVNAVGSSGYADASTTTPASPAPPTAPTWLNAFVATSTSVDLTWTNDATTETSVHVERSVNGGSFEEIAVLGPDASSITDVFAQPSTTYTYRVCVANATFSDYSNTATVTTGP